MKTLEKSVVIHTNLGFPADVFSDTLFAVLHYLTLPFQVVVSKGDLLGAYCLQTTLATTRRIEEDIATSRTSSPGIVLLRTTNRAPLSHGYTSKGAFPWKMCLRKKMTPNML